MKKRIFLFSVFFILLLPASISAQEPEEIMKFAGGDVTASGIEYEGDTITFIGADAQVNINDKDGKTISSFTNIKPQSSGQLAYLELDPTTGDVIKADFTTNEKGGTYFLGGTDFDVPPNSHVKFSKGGGLALLGGGEIKKIAGSGEIKITGDNIKLPEGQTMKGVLNYKNGQAFVERQGKATINGVEIDNSKLGTSEIKVFMDVKNYPGEVYASFGEKNFVSGSSINTQSKINFMENNPYVKVDKGDYFAAEHFAGSEIEIQSRNEEGLIPKIKTIGKITITDGSKSLSASNGEVYIANLQRKNTYAPMEIVLLDESGSSILSKSAETGEPAVLVMTDNGEIAISPEDPKVFSASFDGIIKEIRARLTYYVEKTGKYIEEKTQEARDEVAKVIGGVPEEELEECKGGTLGGKCKLREVEDGS